MALLSFVFDEYLEQKKLDTMMMMEHMTSHSMKMLHKMNMVNHLSVYLDLHI